MKQLLLVSLFATILLPASLHGQQRFWPCNLPSCYALEEALDIFANRIITENEIYFNNPPYIRTAIIESNNELCQVACAGMVKNEQDEKRYYILVSPFALADSVFQMSEAATAHILAHEIAHILLGHVDASYIEELQNDESDEEVLQIELEADSLAFILNHRAGYNSNEVIRIIELSRQYIELQLLTPEGSRELNFSTEELEQILENIDEKKEHAERLLDNQNNDGELYKESTEIQWNNLKNRFIREVQIITSS